MLIKLGKPDGNSTPASSLTFSYTTNSSTNGLIIVSVEEATTSPSCTSDTVTGVTHNGTSLTDLGYYAKDSNGLALKTLTDFPGTATPTAACPRSPSPSPARAGMVPGFSACARSRRRRSDREERDDQIGSLRWGLCCQAVSRAATFFLACFLDRTPIHRAVQW